MNLANSITLLRILLIPAILVCIASYTTEREWVRIVGSVLFVTAAISDALDGYIARNYNQETKLGAVLDPLADKLLVNLSLIFLAVSDQFETQVPMWFPVLVLGRDAAISLGAYLMNKFIGPMRPVPRILGKLTTVFQSAAVAAVLLELFFAPHLLWAVIGLTVVSLIDYFRNGIEKVTEKAV